MRDLRDGSTVLGKRAGDLSRQRALKENSMKTTDDFLAEAKVPKGDDPAEELQGLLKGVTDTRRAFQAGHPNKGYRAAVHAMWNIARVMRAMGVELPDGIAWEEFLLDAKVAERGIKRDCSDEVEWAEYAIQGWFAI
jgi:hypothetical protein